jgi:hypothetical protein
VTAAALRWVRASRGVAPAALAVAAWTAGWVWVLVACRSSWAPGWAPAAYLRFVLLAGAGVHAVATMAFTAWLARGAALPAYGGLAVRGPGPWRRRVRVAAACVGAAVGLAVVPLLVWGVRLDALAGAEALWGGALAPGAAVAGALVPERRR